ncbi:MAG TPA: hypothetical protein VGV35_17040 [Bryobacteraceae bacterium]|nr:hypothetical protein [Bryobacteraceae bacterium]
MTRARAQSRGHKQTPDPPPPSSAALQTAWFRILVLSLAALCLLGLFSTEVADTDFWWHLKTGQYIVQRHALPVPGPFAYTTAINPDAYPGEGQVRHFNLTHEWLSQTMLYGVYSLGGLPAVVLFRAALLGGLCGLVGLLAARRSGQFYAGIAAAFATAWLATWFTVDRPSIVSFFFVAVFLTLLELRRFLWAIPAIALVWANCHGGFFLGWVVLGAYCSETLLADRGKLFQSRTMTPGERRRLWLVTASAIAASAINPNGLGVISTLIRYRQSAMTANLVEWHPPYLWGPPYQFDLLLYAAALTLLISWRRVWRADWLLFAAFTAASLLAFRNILLVGLLAPVLIAAYFPLHIRVPRIAAWLVPPAIAAVLVTGIARGSFYQLHAATWGTPAGAADFLRANKIAGPLFNTYEQGGYLIWKLWPDYRVFIDGRAISESTNKDYQQILYNLGAPVDQVIGPRAQLLDRYGIQTVVTNMFEYNSGAIYPLALALSRSDWQLVYDDAQTLVFLRKPQAGVAAFADKFRRVLEHMDTECVTNIEHAPEASLCARTMADFWMRFGEKARAQRMLQLYLAHAMDRDPVAERTLQQLSR